MAVQIGQLQLRRPKALQITNMIYYLVLFLLYILPAKTITPYISKSKIDIEEPSDIFFDTSYERYYVVSDEGTIKVKDKDMLTIHTIKKVGYDFEAVCVVDSFIYVVDESNKRILKYNISSYKLVNTYDVKNNSPLNSGIESLAYNKKTKTFFAAMEKGPVTILEFDMNFTQIRKVVVKDFSDISSLTFHGDYLYVLSDEDASLSKLDPISLDIIETKYFHIINAEGVTFNASNEAVIVSDALQNIYKFNFNF